MGRHGHPRQRHPLLPRRHWAHNRGIHRDAGHRGARAQHEGTHQRCGGAAYHPAVHPVPHVRGGHHTELPHRVRAEAVLRGRIISLRVLLDDRAGVRPRLVRPGVDLRRDDRFRPRQRLECAHHHVRVWRLLERGEVLRASLTHGVAGTDPPVRWCRTGAHRGQRPGPDGNVQGAAAVLPGPVHPGPATRGSQGCRSHPFQGEPARRAARARGGVHVRRFHVAQQDPGSAGFHSRRDRVSVLERVSDVLRDVFSDCVWIQLPRPSGHSEGRERVHGQDRREDSGC